MKKIIILALAAVIMAGCEQSELEENLKHFGESMKNEPIRQDGMIVTIDSCQYVVGKFYQGAGGCVYTHHNNCRFCKERRQQELKELVEQLKD